MIEPVVLLSLSEGVVAPWCVAAPTGRCRGRPPRGRPRGPGGAGPGPEAGPEHGGGGWRRARTGARIVRSHAVLAECVLRRVMAHVLRARKTPHALVVAYL